MATNPLLSPFDGGTNSLRELVNALSASPVAPTNPLLSPFESGTNSLQGLINALSVSPVVPPRPLTPDEYLRRILSREAVDTSLFSPVRGVLAQLRPTLMTWANGRLLDCHASGSFSKGTANKTGTDIDLFISLSEATIESLKDVYDTLCAAMRCAGYQPKRQNVSINIRVKGYDVDLVPAKRQHLFTNDHSLYRRKADTWTKTNVATHINHVSLSLRCDEIRVLKLWRDQHHLEFPSFYLEMTVIAALSNCYPQPISSLSQNVWKALEYLRDNFVRARVIDPANTNNIISDDLTATEKAAVRSAAQLALSATNWGQVVV